MSDAARSRKYRADHREAYNAKARERMRLKRKRVEASVASRKVPLTEGE